jgi:hypothetical protein
MAGSCNSFELPKGINRAVGEHQPAILAPEKQRLDFSQEDFLRLLRIFDLARGVKEVPRDLERVFYEDGKRFRH